VVIVAQHDETTDVAGALHKALGPFLTRQFDPYHVGEGWCPSVNVYRLPDHLELCVDLAGVDKRHIDVRIEVGKLTIRGIRQAPQPPQTQPGALRILTMEIDHGPFSRVIQLSDPIDLAAVTSEYREGLLWVKLPLQATDGGRGKRGKA
jgi:HSP20 family protein